MLPGWTALSTQPLSVLPAGLDLSIATPLRLLLQDPDAELLFRLDASPGGVAVRLSDRGFRTKPTDTPASTPYPPRLLQPYNFETAIPIPGSGRAEGAAAFGVIEIANHDHDLDALLEYDWEGTEIEIRAGGVLNRGRYNERTLEYDEHGLIARGIVESIEFDESTIRLSMQDPFAKLEKPLQMTTYAGTGGREGGTNIEGLLKPRAFGLVLNADAALIDEALLIYQMNDGPVESIGESGGDSTRAVRDKGIPLTFLDDIDNMADATLEDWTPVAGQYVTDIANGLFRLGAKPEDGRVTADCEGDKVGGVYVETTGEIVRRMATTYGGLTDPDEIDAVSFSALGLPQVVGYYTGTRDVSVRQAIDEMMSGIGWATFTRDGRLRVGKYRAPEDVTPVDTFDAPRALRVSSRPAFPQAWKVRVGYGRLWFVHDPDALAGGVSDAERERLSKERLFADPDVDEDTLDDNPLSRSLDVETFFEDRDDAVALSAEVFALLNPRRRVYPIRLPEALFQQEPGKVIEANVVELGFSATKPLLVVRVAELGQEKSVDLELWG